MIDLVSSCWILFVERCQKDYLVKLRPVWFCFCNFLLELVGRSHPRDNDRDLLRLWLLSAYYYTAPFSRKPCWELPLGPRKRLNWYHFVSFVFVSFQSRYFSLGNADSKCVHFRFLFRYSRMSSNLRRKAS